MTRLPILPAAAAALFTLLASVALPAAAERRQATEWGVAGDPKAARRTIRITMTDHRFSPGIVEVGHNETIRFEVHNAGKSRHEMVIGTAKELQAHAAMMARHPGMEHDEPWLTHVAPGRNGTIVWKFSRVGEFQFGCLVDGHYQAGMVGTIRVVEPAGHKH